MPSSSIVGGNKVVTTAGTQVQLSSTPTQIDWVVITAAPANTGNIVVGDADVDATADAETGISLASGDSVSLPVLDLTDVWIDATVSGDEVGFLYGKSVA